MTKFPSMPLLLRFGEFQKLLLPMKDANETLDERGERSKESHFRDRFFVRLSGRVLSLVYDMIAAVVVVPSELAVLVAIQIQMR